MHLLSVTRRLVGGALLAAAVGPVAGAQTPSICDAVASNLVKNCGFESGNFSSWSQFGNTTGTVVLSEFVNSGSATAWFGPTASPGGITQTIDLTGAGQLSFWLRLFGGGATFDVSWGGTSLLSLTGAPPFNYTQYSFDVVGTGANELKFTFRNDPDFWRLDDIVVTGASAVPEPGVLGLLTLGGLTLLAARRRRHA